MIESDKTNLFWGNETVHEFQTLQVLAWAKGHGKQIKFPGHNTYQWVWRMG